MQQKKRKQVREQIKRSLNALCDEVGLSLGLEYDVEGGRVVLLNLTLCSREGVIIESFRSSSVAWSEGRELKERAAEYEQNTKRFGEEVAKGVAARKAKERTRSSVVRG